MVKGKCGRPPHPLSCPSPRLMFMRSRLRHPTHRLDRRRLERNDNATTNFMRLEPRLENSPGVGSAQPLAFQAEVSSPPGAVDTTSIHGSHSGRGGGGSNMVSRDDTAAMHRLIAQWLTREVGRLARRAADIMPPLDRGRVVRALLHSLGVLAVFFR